MSQTILAFRSNCLLCHDSFELEEELLCHEKIYHQCYQCQFCLEYDQCDNFDDHICRFDGFGQHIYPGSAGNQNFCANWQDWTGGERDLSLSYTSQSVVGNGPPGGLEITDLRTTEQLLRPLRVQAANESEMDRGIEAELGSGLLPYLDYDTDGVKNDLEQSLRPSRVQAANESEIGRGIEAELGSGLLPYLDYDTDGVKNDLEQSLRPSRVQAANELEMDRGIEAELGSGLLSYLDYDTDGVEINPEAPKVQIFRLKEGSLDLLWSGSYSQPSEPPSPTSHNTRCCVPPASPLSADHVTASRNLSSENIVISKVAGSPSKQCPLPGLRNKTPLLLPGRNSPPGLPVTGGQLFSSIIAGKTEKIYQCNKCPLNYTGAKGLSSHFQQHKTGKFRSKAVHRCPKCIRVFRQRLDFTKHVYTHEFFERCSHAP